MDLHQVIPLIEAVVYSSGKPLTTEEVLAATNTLIAREGILILDQVEAALEGIHEKYDPEFYPFEVLNGKEGWHFKLKDEYKYRLAL